MNEAEREGQAVEAFVKSLQYIYDECKQAFRDSQTQMLYDIEEGMDKDAAWQALRERHAQLTAAMHRKLSDRVRWYLDQSK